jgi:hypothetical protein
MLFAPARAVLVLTLLFASAAGAATVYVQPIQICDNFGANCANSNRQLFVDETNKIYAQASVSVVFLSWNVFNAETYLDISSNLDYIEFDQLVAAPGNGANANPLTLNMWFVNSVAGAYGIAYFDANGILIANNVFSFNNGNGRLDTIAHEIGHNLGLDHYEVLNGGCNASTERHLMTTGGCRVVPTSILDIAPDGAQLDLLAASEISIIQASDFVVPEPVSMTITASGLLALLWVRRTR